MIYDHQIHGKSIWRISKDTNRSYSTVHNVITTYIKYGCINRLRNFKEKMSLLKFRQTRFIQKQKQLQNKLKRRNIKDQHLLSIKTQKQQYFCKFGICFSDTEQPFLLVPGAGTSCPFVQADGTAVYVPNECNFVNTDSQIELIDYRFIKDDSAKLLSENSKERLHAPLPQQENSHLSLTADATPSPMFDSLCKFGDINFWEKKGKNNRTYEQYMKLPEP